MDNMEKNELSLEEMSETVGGAQAASPAGSENQIRDLIKEAKLQGKGEKEIIREIQKRYRCLTDINAMLIYYKYA